MNDRTLRSERGAHTALDARAIRSIQLAKPLVRKSSWQMTLPQTPGEASACWLLGCLIACEVIFLAAAIAWR